MTQVHKHTYTKAISNTQTSPAQGKAPGVLLAQEDVARHVVLSTQPLASLLHGQLLLLHLQRRNTNT
jgi:hypothetical protein